MKKKWGCFNKIVMFSWKAVNRLLLSENFWGGGWGVGKQFADFWFYCSKVGHLKYLANEAVQRSVC